MFRVDRGGLVKFALAVQNKKHGEDDNSGNHNIVVRAHFFPPLEGKDKPCDHAPSMIRTPPDRAPACQSGRKKAVAISATPSMAKMFDQYLSMTPPITHKGLSPLGQFRPSSSAASPAVWSSVSSKSFLTFTPKAPPIFASVFNWHEPLVAS